MNPLQKLKKVFSKRSSSPETPNQHTGRVGEQLALDFLRAKTSFRLLERNWSNGQQEIDIIGTEGNVLVFVEVRARAATAKVTGYATLTRKKRLNLRKAAYSYLKTLKQRPLTYRFDAIELRMIGDGADQIHHFRNIQVF